MKRTVKMKKQTALKEIRNNKPLVTNHHPKPPAHFNLQCNPLNWWPVTLFLGRTIHQTPAVKTFSSYASLITPELHIAHIVILRYYKTTVFLKTLYD